MKLYRFRYSPYARKVQIVLDLVGRRYDLVEVGYSQRDELAQVANGYIYVPVVVDDDGTVITESRAICERFADERLVPSPFEGPIWAYHDFVDGPLEDVTFRIGSPAIRDSWTSPSDRALYVLVKERKFGAGCVDAWARDRPALIAKARHLLAPSLATLRRRPFLFGDAPTLADAALYGICKMLEEGDPGLLAALGEPLIAFARRVEAACPRVYG